MNASQRRLDPSEVSALPGRDLEDLLAARNGSHRAGRDLISLHGPSMVRTAWRVLGRYGGTEADDVVQEALIAALTTSSLPTGDVGAWLRAITARKALDWLRASVRRQEQPLPETTGDGAEPAAPASPEGALHVLAVRAALERLSPTDRAVLTLVDLEGHSMAEAAAALGSTRVAIRWRAVRARRKLARLIGPARATGESRA